MIVENHSVIDAAGVECGSDVIVLSIIDSLDWAEENNHLIFLQKKLNSYFSFIDSGQVFDAYPIAIGKVIRIDLLTRYPLPDNAYLLMKKAAEVARELNVEIVHHVHDS